MKVVGIYVSCRNGEAIVDGQNHRIAGFPSLIMFFVIIRTSNNNISSNIRSYPSDFLGPFVTSNHPTFGALDP